MEKNVLLKYFLTDNKSGYKTKEKHIVNKFDGLLDEINMFNLNSEFGLDIPFTQKLYNYIYEIRNIPVCETCGKKIEWKNRFSEGYLKNCSKSCRAKSVKRLDRIKQTNTIKYGVDSPLKTKIFKNKRIDSLNRKLFNRFKSKGYRVLEFTPQKLKIKHPDGHIFWGDRRLLINRLNGGYEVSTELLPINSISSTYEIQLQSFLNKLNIDYESNNRKILDSNKELDLFIKNKNIGIEFDGLYWHSNLFIDKNYHLDKTIECETHNIQLLHIFEDEWTQKQNIVKSLIKNKLGLTRNKIFARKCNIKEIHDNDLVRKFLNENHIQGFVGAKHKIGLFYENELVSLMTFGKSRKALGSKDNFGVFELLRFCNKINTVVVGGASKLFKYFINNYKPNKVISYADRRYSNGNLYKKLGMSFFGETPPNYWYVLKDSKTKEHRFNYRKDVLIKNGYNPEKTENEIMLERGYIRIYDCGNLKYIWEHQN